MRFLASLLAIALLAAAGCTTSGVRPVFFSAGDLNQEHRIVYVMDHSGSMVCSIDYVQYELKHSIARLNKTDQFHVIFYSSGPPVEMPTRRLIEATERNKHLAFEFIDGIIAQGETDPSEALRRAFAEGPDTILVLTDGEFDPQVARLVKDLNKDGKVKVHTYGFLYKTSEAILKQIAAENGGTYKFVTEADLANLARQRFGTKSLEMTP